MAVVLLARDCFVFILCDDLPAFTLGTLGAAALLAVDAALILHLGGVAGIGGSLHFAPPVLSSFAYFKSSISTASRTSTERWMRVSSARRSSSCFWAGLRYIGTAMGFGLAFAFMNDALCIG